MGEEVETNFEINEVISGPGERGLTDTIVEEAKVVQAGSIVILLSLLPSLPRHPDPLPPLPLTSRLASCRVNTEQ